MTSTRRGSPSRRFERSETRWSVASEGCSRAVGGFEPRDRRSGDLDTRRNLGLQHAHALPGMRPVEAPARRGRPDRKRPESRAFGPSNDPIREAATRNHRPHTAHGGSTIRNPAKNKLDHVPAQGFEPSSCHSRIMKRDAALALKCWISLPKILPSPFRLIPSDSARFHRLTAP